MRNCYIHRGCSYMTSRSFLLETLPASHLCYPPWNVRHISSTPELLIDIKVIWNLTRLKLQNYEKKGRISTKNISKKIRLVFLILLSREDDKLEGDENQSQSHQLSSAIDNDGLRLMWSYLYSEMIAKIKWSNRLHTKFSIEWSSRSSHFLRYVCGWKFIFFLKLGIIHKLRTLKTTSFRPLSRAHQKTWKIFQKCMKQTHVELT